jgi:hypothetical protein
VSKKGHTWSKLKAKVVRICSFRELDTLEGRGSLSTQVTPTFYFLPHSGRRLQDKTFSTICLSIVPQCTYIHSHEIMFKKACIFIVKGWLYGSSCCMMKVEKENGGGGMMFFCSPIPSPPPTSLVESSVEHKRKERFRFKELYL